MNDTAILDLLERRPVRPQGDVTDADVDSYVDAMAAWRDEFAATAAHSDAGFAAKASALLDEARENSAEPRIVRLIESLIRDSERRAGLGVLVDPRVPLKGGAAA